MVSRLNSSVIIGLFYLAFSAAILTQIPSTLADTTWTNAVGDNQWSESGNWSNGEPDSFENLTIFPSIVPGSGTITLNANEFVDELRFDGGGYTLTGGALNLFGGVITSNGGSSNPTIASEIKGFAGLTKFGNRPLNLQGANTYSGVTEIMQSALDISGASERIPNSSTVIVNGGTELRFFLGTGTETVGRLIGTGNVVFGNSNFGGTDLRIGATSVDHTFEGNIFEAFGGKGKLTKIGTGKLTLTGNNSYSGITLVSGGELVVDTQSLPAGVDKIVENNAVLIFDQGFNDTYTGVIFGTGSVFKRGTGTLTVGTSPQEYTGGTRIEAGTLAISDESHLGHVSSDVVFAGGTLRVGGSVDFETRSFEAESGTNARFDILTDASAGISGGISGAGGLIKDGPGTLVLGVTPSSYAGSTTINAGALVLTSTQLIPNTDLTVNADAALTLLGNVIQNVRTLSGAGTIDFTTGSFLSILTVGLESGGASTTFSGNIIQGAGATGTIRKWGSGALTLTGANTYSGNTVLFEGFLLANNTTGSATGTGAVFVEGGAVLGGAGAVASVAVLDGTIAPGPATGASTGTLIIGGDLDLTIFAPGMVNRSVNIELGGTAVGQFDRLRVLDVAVLAGDLNVSLINSYVPALGDSFDIFDWSTLFGVFTTVNLPPLGAGLAWNASQLYTTGILSVARAGDFDLDGDVDGRDFLIWQRGGSPNPLSAGDLAEWQANYGVGALAGVEDDPARSAASPVPEPTTWLVLICGAGSWIVKRSRVTLPSCCNILLRKEVWKLQHSLRSSSR